MHLSEDIINDCIEKVETGEKLYVSSSHEGYAGEIYKRLKEKHPETVMVDYKGYIFVVFSREGKERVRERLQPKLNDALKDVEKLKECMKMLGEDCRDD